MSQNAGEKAYGAHLGDGMIHLAEVDGASVLTVARDDGRPLPALLLAPVPPIFASSTSAGLDDLLEGFGPLVKVLVGLGLDVHDQVARVDVDLLVGARGRDGGEVDEDAVPDAVVRLSSIAEDPVGRQEEVALGEACGRRRQLRSSGAMDELPTLHLLALLLEEPATKGQPGSARFLPGGT